MPDIDWQALALPGADVRLARFCDSGQATRWFERLRAEIPWRQQHVRLFGREHPMPRLSRWIGDADAHYRYSGQDFVPEPWTPALTELRAALNAGLGVAFNSVLCNLYRDGHDAMGWHSDAERELGLRPTIASLSFGATRRFRLRPRGAGATHDIALESGSLLLMAGDTQQNYRHALPRTAKPVGARINLTFRHIFGSGKQHAGHAG
jgi:alkylated DNA repair dioxygenase AlkB